MEITEVKVFLVGEEKLKAFVSIVIDRCFMINDVKVIQGREGLFISMPSRRKKNGEFKDVAHPLNNDTRTWMEDRILREYDHRLQMRDIESRSRGSHNGDSLHRSAHRPEAASPQVEFGTANAAEQHQPNGGPGRRDQVVTFGGDGRSSPEAVAGEAKLERHLEEVRQKHLSDSFWSVDWPRTGTRSRTVRRLV